MIINFIGNFQVGYVGESTDESHLSKSLELLGHTVRRVPRDVWKAYCDGYWEEKWVDEMPLQDADANIICKWHHFGSDMYIQKLKQRTLAPVFYWVWDWMNEFNPDSWNFKMAKAADLYLTGEGGLVGKYRAVGVPAYYFNMDCCDPLSVGEDTTKEIKWEVVFTGSYIHKGHRKDWLPKIAEKVPVKIFSWNWEEWKKVGFDNAEPAVYGVELNDVLNRSSIALGFNVEPNCWGYWSNRVGKVLNTRCKLIQEYAPGMEQFLPPTVDYFNSPDEAVIKIIDFLVKKSSSWKGNSGFSLPNSYQKMQQLSILIDRYNKRTDNWII